MSGPQGREGPWVRDTSRLDFDFFRFSRGRGPRGRGEPLENSKSTQGFAVGGGGGEHVPHLGAKNFGSIARGGGELSALEVRPGVVTVFAPEVSAIPLVFSPLKTNTPGVTP